MIKNKLEVVKEEDLYKDVNIVYKGPDEKHIYIDGSQVKSINQFLKLLNFSGEYKREEFNYDGVKDYMEDIFTYDNKERKIVVIISNLAQMLNNLQNTNLTKAELIELLNSNNKEFNDGVTVFFSGDENRKSIDIYLSDDDINFGKLEEIINDREENEHIDDELNKFTSVYPMGTVVRLKDKSRDDKLSEYSYMITDRFVLTDESSKEYYEYKANIYPIGSLPNGKGIMFNNEDISLVEFVGYETAMDRNLVEDVKKKLEEKNISKIKIDVH